ncbi:MAG TPA: UDP-N-acetyl-D-glucosamine dehydrogenase [Elusimicrobia bacterium]|nr:UDP-N-acetyl-D-glucosamine dehydrogenase [Elusimicrobiota bacterium]HBT63017.1 UDP-N-acetyl-D-glucosamine dehydrogenase [Elusimicrobiota bacterium]
MTPLGVLRPVSEESLGSPERFAALKRKIQEGTATVGVVGLGYVGLPLACAFAEKGYPTTGFEVDAEKPRRIAAGSSYIGDISDEDLGRAKAGGRLKATTDFSLLKEQDAIIICVPTPLRKSKDPDISYILAATHEIEKTLRPGQLIILESTTYPGTTREILLPAFTRKDFQLGRDFFLAFSPERVDPGNKEYKIHNTPKVVGGATPRCLELSALLYGKVARHVFPVTSLEVAEMAKLLENTFRAVNIGMVNEMAMMCGRLGISISEVVEAAKTKPFGYMPFYPGPGIGGHCIPLDPHYLAWKMRTLDFEPRFIELAGAINSRMPEYVVERAEDILNLEQGKALSRSQVLVLGVSYKKDISDMRESPAIEVIEHLLLKKARVSYHDPYVAELEVAGSQLRSVALDERAVSSSDLVLIVTDHSAVDYGLVVQRAQLVLDTRNVLKDRAEHKIFRL